MSRSAVRSPQERVVQRQGVCVQKLRGVLGAGAVEPSQVPDFAIRYGIQVGYVFGFQFGYGIIKDICFITFVFV